MVKYGTYGSDFKTIIQGPPGHENKPLGTEWITLVLMQEEEYVELAKRTVAECHPEHLLAESKFLLTESLQGWNFYSYSHPSVQARMRWYCTVHTA